MSQTPDDAPHGQTPPPDRGGETTQTPPKRKTPALWWALVALLSPMLVNIVLTVIGEPEVEIFSTLLGSIVSGVVCVAVITPRIQTSLAKGILTRVLLLGVSTLAAFILACCGCTFGGMYSQAHHTPQALVPRLR
jgi:hypothetical protein